MNNSDSVLTISKVKEILDISPCSIFIPFCEETPAVVTAREEELQKCRSECTILRVFYSEIINT